VGTKKVNGRYAKKKKENLMAALVRHIKMEARHNESLKNLNFPDARDETAARLRKPPNLKIAEYVKVYSVGSNSVYIDAYLDQLKEQPLSLIEWSLKAKSRFCENHSESD
jgi:hypothetical protein